jgi:Ni,Fe-hydrogenase III component G
MTAEEKIKEDLCARFAFLSDQVRIARVRRIFAEVPQDHFAEVFEFAIKELKFVMLCTITGLDEGATLGIIYHLAQESGVTLNLHTHVPKDKPVVQTVSNHFPAADVPERELIDLLGIDVQGLPPGHRYPLPDDWPKDEHPLRKDWKPRSERKEEAAHG